MLHDFVIHPDAKQDMADAMEWYASVDEELAQRFLDECSLAIQRACYYPQAYRLFRDKHRKVNLQHFPYGIFFREAADSLIVIAVIDLRTDPISWPGKLGSRS